MTTEFNKKEIAGLDLKRAVAAEEILANAISDLYRVINKLENRIAALESGAK